MRVNDLLESCVSYRQSWRILLICSHVGLALLKSLFSSYFQGDISLDHCQSLKLRWHRRCTWTVAQRCIAPDLYSPDKHHGSSRSIQPDCAFCCSCTSYISRNPALGVLWCQDHRTPSAGLWLSQLELHLLLLWWRSTEFPVSLREYLSATSCTATNADTDTEDHCWCSSCIKLTRSRRYFREKYALNWWNLVTRYCKNSKLHTNSL